MNNLNFRMSELIYSDTAVANNIDNTPNVSALDCLLQLIVLCLQPVREKLGAPMVITSGYRSTEVNALVGGADNSQHTKGQAADFTVSGYTPAQLVTLIKGYGIEFDQLINEYDQWVHISYVRGNNRGEVLKY